MHARFSCSHGCGEGTAYKLGVTTQLVNGEMVDVCEKHRKPVKQITKAKMSGHAKLFQKKGPPASRKVMTPIALAFR